MVSSSSWICWSRVLREQVGGVLCSMFGLIIQLHIYINSPCNTPNNFKEGGFGQGFDLVNSCLFVGLKVKTSQTCRLRGCCKPGTIPELF